MPKPTAPSPQITILTTRRFLLRAARPDDLTDLFEIYQDPDAMRFWSSPPDGRPEQTKLRIDRMIDGAKTPPVAYFVLEKDGKAIGTAGGNKSGEVGFILHKDFWRQGLISEAMSAIIPHLWQVLDVDELMADVDPNNHASIGLLTSLGFQITGTKENTYHINGVWSDSVYFGLPRPI